MRKGFTLIEVMIVIAIIWILISLVFGGIKQHRKNVNPADKTQIEDGHRITLDCIERRN